MSTIRIFGEGGLREYLDNRRAALQEEVRAEDRNKLLNVNETEYVEYLTARYRIEPLVLHWDKESVTDREAMVPAERFDRSFDVESGRRYLQQVVTYHLPFSGETDLLHCIPSTHLVWTERVGLLAGTHCITHEVIAWNTDSAGVKQRIDNFKGCVRKQADNVAVDVDEFNKALEKTARDIVQGRKGQLLRQLNMVAGLGIPVHKAGNVPATFAVPVMPKKIVVKPSAPAVAYAPEPTLDDPNYQQILQMLHQWGVEMERHPDIYQGKGEETLRDHFLMMLSPHFQSVTGETFNRAGKTDILIRHEGKNVFVAECKFWSGIKAFHETIDQILRYLTWRDSKAAVLCFVPNKELNPVLQQIESETAKHPCFVKHHGKKADGWYNFEFHLKDDHTRSVKLAVLCFHFPEQPQKA